MSTTAKVLLAILFLGIAIAVGAYFYKKSKKKSILPPAPGAVTPTAPVPGINPAASTGGL